MAFASAAQATPPAIRTSASNPVPACVTPGKLMQFLGTRNNHLKPEFESIAELYKKHGEALSVRWDYAFYQMAIETNFLSYRTGSGSWGDVNPKQYNFAGIGTTGGGVPGDAFPDASAGVLAQMQHLVVYSGERVANPTAKRTREKQDDILSWTAKLAERRPVTFSDLAGRWAVDRRYARSIESIAERFRAGFCNSREDQAAAAAEQSNSPVAGNDEDEDTARKGRKARAAGNGKTRVAKLTSKKRNSRDEDEDDATARKSTKGKPRSASRNKGRENDEDDDGAAKRGGKLSKANTAGDKGDEDQGKPAQVANGAKGSAAAKPGAANPAIADSKTVGERMEALAQSPPAPPLRSGLGLGLMAQGSVSEPAAAPGTCKVWTASYGGSKAVIIKAPLGTQLAFTVLGVTDDNAKTEIDSYIAAYAKGGQAIGEYKSEDAALAKAFELCPKA